MSVLHLKTPPHPADESERGLRVLIDLVEGREPASITDEREALRVLQLLSDGEPGQDMERDAPERGSGPLGEPARTPATLAMLLERLCTLTAADVRNRLDGFEPPPPGVISRLLTRMSTPLGGAWRALIDRATGAWKIVETRARARLLFVLLAALTARIYRYEVLGALVREEVIGGHDRLDALVSWLRERRPRTREVAVVESYARLVRTTLYAQADQGRTLDASLDAAEFSRWPWTRQLMGLEHRFERGERFDPGWPANRSKVAGELEYELARRGHFGRLSHRGGVVASRALERLDYRDARCPPRRWPVGAWAVALLLLAVATGIAAYSIVRVHAWDRQARANAEEVIHRARGVRPATTVTEVPR
jgi:hypothetical protein